VRPKEKYLMRVLRLFAATQALLITAGVASAQLLEAPPWRAQRGAIYQLWTFDHSANPASAEVSHNPHAPVVARMTVGEFGTGWYTRLPASQRTGLWDLGRFGTMVVELPALAHHQAYGEIRLSVTYLRDLHQDPEVVVDNAADVSGPMDPICVEPDMIGGAWFTTGSVWAAIGGASPPVIRIVASYHGSLIDRLELDVQVIRSWPIPGDANFDCRVNVLDLIYVRNRIGQSVDSGDNWTADVNEDGEINVLDLIYVRNRLNTFCP